MVQPRSPGARFSGQASEERGPQLPGRAVFDRSRFSLAARGQPGDLVLDYPRHFRVLSNAPFSPGLTIKTSHRGDPGPLSSQASEERGPQLPGRAVFDRSRFSLAARGQPGDLVLDYPRHFRVLSKSVLPGSRSPFPPRPWRKGAWKPRTRGSRLDQSRFFFETTDKLISHQIFIRLT